MTAAEPVELPSIPRRPPLHGTMGLYARLTGGYWHGRTGRVAWMLTIGCALLIGLNIAVQFGINEWNRYFFDALDQRNATAVFRGIGLFGALALVSTLIAAGSLLVRMRLQVGWRQWLAVRLTEYWLAEQRFYRLNIAAPDIDSPEFRIAEDARVATQPLIDFGWGITSAVLMAGVFLGVLWSAGGSATVAGITIPGFMVFAAVAYALIMSGSMVLLGRPLISRIEAKNRAEAQLRQTLGRVRENAESIAMIRGEADEVAALRQHFATVIACWHGVIAHLGRITLLTNTNGVASPVVPLLLLAPNYLSGDISLGGVMQATAAFVQVQVALNWLVDNYAGIAEWFASVGRVTGLWTALSDLDATVGDTHQERITIATSDDDRIHIEGLSVAQYNGRIMIDEADTIIEAGEKVLLTGASGTGKSTLIRAIAGLWPWGSGRVRLPAQARIAFLPQRAYLPTGTLRQALEYPAATIPHADAVLQRALTRCGLKRLIPKLDTVDQWEKRLSGGEQQRLAFARLLVQRPDIVIMDEATSALDTDSQDSMLDLFLGELSGCTVISVGHRPELVDYHFRTLVLTRRDSGVTMTSNEDVLRGKRLASLLRRSLRPRPSPDAVITIK